MLIENDFEVPAPIDRTWEYLLDVERVAPCAPGAELTEVVDDHTWKGRMLMKLGPVSLSFSGTVTMRDRDDGAHRVVLAAMGQETRGKGAASVAVTSWLEDLGGSTRVRMQADITLSGTVAQLSRGLLPDVSAKLTHRFAECLRTSIDSEGPTAPESTPGEAQRIGGSDVVTTPRPPPRTRAIGGIRLGLWAIWRAIVRFFRRLFGG